MSDLDDYDVDELVDEQLEEDLDDVGADAPRCVGCGCSATRPCPGGCIWATPNLCSRCV